MDRETEVLKSNVLTYQFSHFSGSCQNISHQRTTIIIEVRKGLKTLARFYWIGMHLLKSERQKEKLLELN